MQICVFCPAEQQFCSTDGEQFADHLSFDLYEVMLYSQWTSTLKQLESHGCVFSTVATDAQVLMHPLISVHSVDEIIIVSGQFHTEMSKFSKLWRTMLDYEIIFWKKIKLVV